MSHPFLFGNGNSQQQSKYLVEFKAGKMTMNGSTVTPIKRKGLVYLHQSDDNLMHFCWKDRQTGVTEDDLILFPDDAEFKKVPQCTTGRVFVLKFKTSKRCFYWMQEPSSDKDDDFCKKINEYLNNPPTPGSRGSSSGGPSLSGGLGSLGSLAELGSLRESEFQNLLNNINPQQLMQMIGMQNSSGLSSRPHRSGISSVLSGTGANSSSLNRVGDVEQSASRTTSEATATNTSSSGSSQPRIQLGDLQSIISGLSVPKGDQQDKGEIKALSSIIKSEALQTLLANEEFMKGVKERLPPTETAESASTSITLNEQVSSTLQSPQFQQALNKFGMALQSGQLGPLLHQFGLSQACIEAANKGDLEAFVKVLEEEEKKNQGDKKEEIGRAHV